MTAVFRSVRAGSSLTSSRIVVIAVSTDGRIEDIEHRFDADVTAV